MATMPAHHGHADRRLVDRDEEHLRILGIYHLVIAGINVLMLILFVLVPMLVGPAYFETMGMAVPQQGQLLVGLIAGGMMTLVFALNGWSMLTRRNRISCIILSVIECLSIPVGLILGISAILVLRRDSVKTLFNMPHQNTGNTAAGPA